MKYNQARVYAPGAPLLSYDKHHMLPPFESKFKPGTTLTLMPRAFRNLGRGHLQGYGLHAALPAVRRGGRGPDAGARVGFRLWTGAWHGHIAVMRGVEDGFSIARAAKQGYLTVSDDRGRILAETRSDSAPFATLVADVPVVHDDHSLSPAGRLVRVARAGDARFHARAAIPVPKNPHT